MELQAGWIIIVVCFTAAQAGKYDIYEQASSWEEARDTCEEEGKKLVTVRTDDEHVRIRNMKPWITGHFWIGLRKVDAHYKWTDESVAKFTVWGQGQPVSQSECVRYSMDTFKWETHNCSAPLYFICENDVPTAKISGVETAATGLAIGFCSMFGLLLVGCILLQLPCCRTYTVKTIGQIGLGRGRD